MSPLALVTLLSPERRPRTARVAKLSDRGMATAEPRSGETTPARVPPGRPEHHHLDAAFEDAAPISNIESFVVSTVPLVAALDPEPSRLSDGGNDGTIDAARLSTDVGCDRFALRDLWSFFDEWSAYGVEVPLTLDDEEHEVFQYYVPFLSGIQIYKKSAAAASRGGADASGAASDGSSPKVPNADSRNSDRAPSADERETPVVQKCTPPLPSGIDAATRSGEDVPGRELVFQYFEQASPYSRPPFSDAVARLRAEHPILFELESDALHPASWMSVAWYPIYRIPVGQTLRDLSACFLTYHALSTQAGAGTGAPGTGMEEKTGVPDEEKEKQPPPHLRGCPPPPPASATGEAAMASRANRLMSSDPSGRRRIRLRAFGLAYYKLRGELWRPAEVADWLKTMQGGARSWLRGQKVIHPDFEFFSHRG